MQEIPLLKQNKLESLAGKLGTSLSAQIYIVVKRWIDGFRADACQLSNKLVDLIMVESFVYCGYSLSKKMETVLSHQELILFNDILNRVFIIFFSIEFRHSHTT